MLPLTRPFMGHLMIAFLVSVFLGLLSAPQASAQVTAFKQAVAEAAAKDKDIAAFYKANNFKPIWTGIGGRHKSRRQALLKAVSNAGLHGLPVGRYNPESLKAMMKNSTNARQRGATEVELSRIFLQYSRDLQTGALTPRKIDSGIVRAVPYRDRTSYLRNFAKSSPQGFLKALQPQSPEYTQLMKAKLGLEKQLARGGWGPKVSAKSLKPGSSGNAVVALRNRLAAMGYLGRSASGSFDANLQKAVQQFQSNHGLSADGVAGPSTIAAVNVSPEKRLQSIIVAMERERWNNRPLGKRHINVNITDFTAKIYDNNKLTFETVAVVGKNDPDRRTPEFSDVMEFMVINPSWYVPRSITTKEYLPLLQRNRNAVKHLEITDSKGRKVNRSNVNFAKYNEKTFPFSMRQPPSRGNALGLVKFIFPNKYNIYLHDTPSKNLFSREKRDFSHGCIRLAQPFDFAYALLAKQTNDPKGFFQAKLATNAEARVNLKEPVPVHIMYRTAFTSPRGQMEYRNDVYGRDAKIWNALSKAGVALRAVQG